MAKKNVIEGSNKVSASQLKDFFRQIDEGSITGDHIQAILERRNFFNENPELTLISKKEKLYEIEVDGTKTFDELNKKCNYEFECSEPTFDDFSIINKVKRKSFIKLFNFDDKFTSFEIIEKMLNENFQPSTLEENLCLVAREPQLRTQFSIVALGSLTNDDTSNVPILIQGSRTIETVPISNPTDKTWHEWDPMFKYRFAGTKIQDQ